MNKWQKIFLGIGVVSILIVTLLPPQVVSVKNVQYLPITAGYPVDWLQFFFIVFVILIISGLGILVNREHHEE